jgi:uncharacterized membrane protein YhaH (DUF805 family)
MSKYFSFNGVAKRQQYWAVHALAFCALIVAFAAVAFEPYGALLTVAIAIGIIWLSLSTVVRRLRDAGLSPYWVLLTLVPYVGGIATIVFGCIGSANGEHE